jgi:type VI secretion system secreted protein VgrG
VNFISGDKKPASNIAYELVREDGAAIEGKTAPSGSTSVQKSSGFESYTIRYKGELP